MVIIEIIKWQARKHMRKKSKDNKTHTKTNANEKRQLHCIKKYQI